MTILRSHRPSFFEPGLWDHGMVIDGLGQKPDWKKMTRSVRQWYGHWWLKQELDQVNCIRSDVVIKETQFPGGQAWAFRLDSILEVVQNVEDSVFTESGLFVIPKVPINWTSVVPVVLSLLFLSTPYSVPWSPAFKSGSMIHPGLIMHLSKAFPSTWNCKAHPILSFQFIKLSCRGIYLAHTFNICRCSHKAVWIALWLVPCAYQATFFTCKSVIALWWFSSNWVCTQCIILLTVLFSLPDRAASLTVAHHLANFLCHCLQCIGL